MWRMVPCDTKPKVSLINGRSKLHKNWACIDTGIAEDRPVLLAATVSSLCHCLIHRIEAKIFVLGMLCKIRYASMSRLLRSDYLL